MKPPPGRDAIDDGVARAERIAADCGRRHVVQVGRRVHRLLRHRADHGHPLGLEEKVVEGIRDMGGKFQPRIPGRHHPPQRYQPVVEHLNALFHAVGVRPVDPAVPLHGRRRAVEKVGGHIGADLHRRVHFAPDQHQAGTEADEVFPRRDPIVDESRAAIDADEIHLAVGAAVLRVGVVKDSLICALRSVLREEDAVQGVIVLEIRPGKARAGLGRRHENDASRHRIDLPDQSQFRQKAERLVLPLEAAFAKNHHGRIVPGGRPSPVEIGRTVHIHASRREGFQGGMRRESLFPVSVQGRHRSRPALTRLFEKLERRPVVLTVAVVHVGVWGLGPRQAERTRRQENCGKQCGNSIFHDHSLSAAASRGLNQRRGCRRFHRFPGFWSSAPQSSRRCRRTPGRDRGAEIR